METLKFEWFVHDPEQTYHHSLNYIFKPGKAIKAISRQKRGGGACSYFIIIAERVNIKMQQHTLSYACDN